MKGLIHQPMLPQPDPRHLETADYHLDTGAADSITVTARVVLPAHPHPAATISLNTTCHQESASARPKYPGMHMDWDTRSTQWTWEEGPTIRATYSWDYFYIYFLVVAAR